MYLEVYERNKKNEKVIQMDYDNYNIEQFKHYLNELTVRLFGTKSEISKKLMFDTKKSKRNNNYKIKFADLTLQEILYNYTLQLEGYLSENDNAIKNSKRIKIEKLCYLLKNNPKSLLRKR